MAADKVAKLNVHYAGPFNRMDVWEVANFNFLGDHLVNRMLKLVLTLTGSTKNYYVADPICVGQMVSSKDLP